MSDVQFFLAYLAQGVQRVGKDYMRTQASSVLGGDVRSLQLFYNLLPEFGSLPWTLKPLLMFGADRFLSAGSRTRFAGLVALATASTWAAFAIAPPSPGVFLLYTATVSLGSATVDGLVDGRVAEASRDGESAAQCRYLCECGSFVGGLLIGALAWALALGQEALLLLTALAWAAAAPFIALRGDSDHGAASVDAVAPATAAPLPAPPVSKGGGGGGIAGCRQGGGDGAKAACSSPASMALVSALAFIVCLSPGLDFFLFRQHRLGLGASEQSLVSVGGSCGWFLGAATYRHHLAPGRPAHSALAWCLAIWPCGSFLSVLVAASAAPGGFGLASAFVEKMSAEFCKALTFMPCTVLMQLHCPAGCESTVFTLMQCSGTVGSVLSRNLEFCLMRSLGVDPSLGQVGFDGFALVVVVATVWRLLTAAALRAAVVPRLAREAAAAAASGEAAAAPHVAPFPAKDE